MERIQSEYRKELFFSTIKLFHFLLSCLLFYIFWMLFRYGKLFVERTIDFRYNYFTAIGYGILLFFFNRTYNSYLLGYSRIRDCVFAEFLSQLFSVVIIYFAVSFAWNHWNNPVIFLGLLIVQIIFDAVWAFTGNQYYFKLYPPKKTILVYRSKLDKKRFGSLKGKPSERLYTITTELMFDGSFAELKEHLGGYDAIFVAGVNNRCRNGILKYCKEENSPGFFLPHVGDVIMQEAMHIQSFDSPVLYVKRSSPKPEYRIIKRGFDLAVSAIALILLSPILIVTGLAIRLYDGGPAIYKQVRLTRNGKKFKIWNLWRMRRLANINKLQRGFRPVYC